MRNFNNKGYIYWSILLIVTTVQSCRKTEYLEYEKEPLNKIIEFKITNSTQELFGAIDHNDNTVRLYIPYYLGVDYLTPSIKLETGAHLVDDKGNEINLDGGVDPIAVGDTSYYHVRSIDSIMRTYTFIQQYLPFNEALKAGYTTSMEDTEAKEAVTTGRFNLYGNFASTSTNARFVFTDKETGNQFDDYTQVVSVTPSEEYYTMVVELVHEAMAGEYSVMLEHQGRTAQLPDVKINYTQPYPTFFSSSANYAIGDTISFTPSYAEWGNGGVYLDVDRVYLKILPNATVPDGFDTSLYNEEIEFEIASQTRREVKVIVPEILPSGLYGSISNAIVFYFDYAAHTGWGKGIRTGVLSNQFTINPKP